MNSLSVRWRLTIVFALVTLVTSSILLTGVYAVVRASQERTPDLPEQGTAAQQSVDDLIESRPRRDQRQVEEAVSDVRDEAVGETLDKLVVWSLVGLAGTGAVAVMGGWFFAGRALRPVHTITRRARAISAASLTERIGLDGPADELRELAETFDQMLERLEGAFALERRLVATMSHELRTPLANQQAALDLVLSDPEAAPAQLRWAAQTALEQSERANRTIDALLTLARAEAGYADLDHVDVALDELTGALVRAAREASDLDWRIDLQPARLAGHRELLARMVQNLLANAVDHNAPGGYVDVRVHVEGETAVLSICNPGRAIDPEAARELTLPFRRGTPDRTAAPGVGLGLSIVEAIVRHHGGRLELDPLPGGGLRAVVLLPTALRRDGSAGSAPAGRGLRP